MHTEETATPSRKEVLEQKSELKNSSKGKVF
jgi:hypothetical protein